ncbi:MAG TPA: class I SAM-dependent methyltransferase [Candidatus Limnocylindrales bacterium]|nr:class I SAM-dependent methyltransferase [Candidatus Limnocylindrales bacterium]
MTADAGEVTPAARRAALLARYYDLDLSEDPGDLDLYLALARRTGGPILELAAGSGRLAVPLARAGFAVTAVDNDPAMLARARARWDEPHRRPPRGHDELALLEADLLEVDLGAHFGLVLLALNSLLLLVDRERQAAALRAMTRHLRPDGIAVVDAWLPAADELAAYDGRLVHEWTRTDPETGEQVTKWGSARFDSATGTVTLDVFFDASPAEGGPLQRVSRHDRLRLMGADELVALAAAAGLRTETLAGDHALSPFGPGAERAVLVAALV